MVGSLLRREHARAPFTVVLLLTLAGYNIELFGQCLNTTSYGSAPAPAAGTVQINSCNWQTEYSLITGVVAGQTYTAANVTCGGYITVRQTTWNGPVVAFGPSPLTWVANVAGNHFLHWNTNAACGTSTANCCITTIAAGAGGYTGLCCTANSTPGCENSACTAAICALDAFCCSTLWDALCAGAAVTNANGGGVCSGVSNCPTWNGTCPGGQIEDCNGNCAPASWLGDNDCDQGQWTWNGNPIYFNCAALNWDNGDCVPTTPTCCLAHGGTGCQDAACQAAVCAVDPTCCSVIWDAVCASFAIANATSGGVCEGVSNCPGAGQCAPGLGGAAFPGSGSIQIQQNLTPAQLITDVFLGDCLTASNIVFTGTTAAVGTFSNGWRIGIESGIILTTGSAALAVGPNNTTSASMVNNLGGHALLTTLAGVTTYDASVFQFSFTPETDQVTFTYVFGSEEYPEWVCDIYNDVFGFFVSGPGYAPNTNIATIPGTLTPVAIDNVNNNGWCAPYYPDYYQPYPSGPHNQYDGFSLPLTACINTIPCETYSIIIAVADAGDWSYDSAVFLAAESFTAGVDVGISATDEGGATSGAENCGENGCFVFTLEQPLAQDLTLTYLVQHTGSGQFFDPIPVTVTFPAGVTEVSVCIEAIPGTMGTELNSVEITLDTSQSPLLGCTCATGGELVTSVLYFCDPETVLPVTWLGFEAHAVNDGKAVDCLWQTATESNSSHFTVERSADLSAWTAIGTLPAVGYSEVPVSYALRDEDPMPGIAYYRVQQVDTDGRVDHSVVRQVDLNIGPSVQVYPNPGSGIFQVRGLDGGQLVMMDMRGARIPFHLTADGALTLPGAAPGIYMADVRWGSGREPERIRIVVR